MVMDARSKMGRSESVFAAMVLLLLPPLIASPASAQYNVERSDPFAMLSATLQTYQGNRGPIRFVRLLGLADFYLSFLYLYL